MAGTDTRGRILAAAEDLLALRGFDSLRLRDIAKAAEVSIGSIQHHFETRDEVLLETLRTAGRRRAEQWSQLAADGTTPSARVHALIRGALGERHRCIVWVETCAAATRHPALVADVQRTQEAWRSAFSAAIEEGVRSSAFTPATPVPEVVDVLVGLVDGLMLAVAVEDDETTHRYRVDLLERATARLLGEA